MNLIFKGFSAVALSISALTAFASPTYLTTHNNTTEESNAYIAGVPSAYPTPANSTQRVYWNLVKLACYGHTTGRQCSAVIKMATNTSNPIEVGEVHMDLDTGDITPKFLSKNGYTLTVNGLGEATITKK
ncbi:hypothetical protein [Legionella sp. PC997]|uniref:hypothetical protein n=1 Tax=Legionella sp. PC997 TaxID=2755562 RepID=UPI0015F9B3F3|nr:hypothetical protein [Legionella sp. PC997]QMT59939.1 hypothetical protein HBNCFIEN_01308 [Legionella sp. PC997]